VSAPVVVVGDALLDVDVEGRVERTSPDAEVPVLDVTREIARPGGAGLAAVLLAAQGAPVTFVTALADDDSGARLRVLLDRALTLVDGPATGGTVVKCRWRCAERPLLRTDKGLGEPAARFADRVVPALAGAVERAGAVLVSDYGRGVAANPGVRAVLADAVRRGTPVVWDPHPRGPGPVPGVRVATPNLAEAARAAGRSGAGEPQLEAGTAGRRLLGLWDCAAVAVTTGERGAVLARPRTRCVTVGAPRVRGGDPCGAGDAFAGRLAALLAEGARLDDAVRGAVESAAGFVGGGGAGTVDWDGAGWRQVRASVPVGAAAR
jgi:rfaE bifunctional protein kinase chain/domain